MRTTASRIRQINLVMVPSTDQDRSIAFYESLGFEKRADAPFGDGHGIVLSADDIDAAHAQLRSLGVDVDPEVAAARAPDLSFPVP